MDGEGFKYENAKIRVKGVDFCGGIVQSRQLIVKLLIYCIKESRYNKYLF